MFDMVDATIIINGVQHIASGQSGHWTVVNELQLEFLSRPRLLLLVDAMCLETKTSNSRTASLSTKDTF